MSHDRGPHAATVVRRVVSIVLAVTAMAWVIGVLAPEPDRSDGFRSVSIVRPTESGAPIQAEIGQFLDLREGLHVVSMGDPSPHVVVPSRAERRARRPYDGAPPQIPHPVAPEQERTQDCAPCHTFGGYNPTLRTYSPRTPHPELSDCMQCHVARTETTLLVQTDWVTPAYPEVGRGGELVGAPPRIPHTLQLRERCSACHGGASAAPDIRTTHPDRHSCRQCHLSVEEPGAEFARPTTRGGGGE